LSVEHNADGTLKNAAAIADAQIKADSSVQSVNSKPSTSITLTASEVGAATSADIATAVASMVTKPASFIANVGQSSSSDPLAWHAIGRNSRRATARQTTGVKLMALTTPIAASATRRTVWVGFIAAGTTLPRFGYNGGNLFSNLGLASPGPQIAGNYSGQSTAPLTVAPAAMLGANVKWWVGLS
jgi:hypothetical protein